MVPKQGVEAEARAHDQATWHRRKYAHHEGKRRLNAKHTLVLIGEKAEVSGIRDLIVAKDFPVKPVCHTGSREQRAGQNFEWKYGWRRHELHNT